MIRLECYPKYGNRVSEKPQKDAILSKKWGYLGGLVLSVNQKVIAGGAETQYIGSAEKKASSR